MKSRAVFLGFPLAMIVEPDGTVVEKIEAKPLEGVPPPSAADLDDAKQHRRRSASSRAPATSSDRS